PAGPTSGFFVASLVYHPSRRSFRRTDGRQRVGRQGPTARDLAKVAPAQNPSPPSRPAHAPPRGLLLLLLQQQLDALSDE
ncbi:MAG: hypothetical protein ACXWIM_24000, partial [Burkholderiales bacterium]